MEKLGIGNSLSRDEMSQIMAGSGIHYCHCYCGPCPGTCPHFDTTHVQCDPGGGVDSHEYCLGACKIVLGEDYCAPEDPYALCQQGGQIE